MPNFCLLIIYVSDGAEKITLKRNIETMTSLLTLFIQNFQILGSVFESKVWLTVMITIFALHPYFLFVLEPALSGAKKFDVFS